MAQKFDDLIPMLICDDTQQSIRFYTEVLGFTVTARMDDVGRSGWASLNQGNAQIMLASPSYFPQPVKVDGRYPQMVLYFYPEDVVALHAAVRAKGYEATELVVRFYGMREFEMLDPSGHVLVFGQETDDPATPVE